MEMLRIYPNTIPLTGDCLDWMESDIRPDWWTWHFPRATDVKVERRECPIEYEDAYRWFVVWLINEAAFDQLYRRPQTSHREYQQVVDWCLATEKEAKLFLPAHWTGMTVSAILADCGWFGLHWSRFPYFVTENFAAADWHILPHYSDPRHPDYVSPKQALLALSRPD